MVALEDDVLFYILEFLESRDLLYVLHSLPTGQWQSAIQNQLERYHTIVRLAIEPELGTQVNNERLHQVLEGLKDLRPSPNDERLTLGDLVRTLDVEEHWQKRWIRLLYDPSKMAAALPTILQQCKNLRSFVWRLHKAPDKSILRELQDLAHLTELALEASGLSEDWYHAREFLAELPARDSSSHLILPFPISEHGHSFLDFFQEAGTRLTNLSLGGMDEVVYELFASRAHLFVRLERLHLGFSGGVWDWDGRGSPQRGPTAAYIFPRLACAERIRHASLSLADLSITRSTPNPLTLFNSTSLQSLTLHISSGLGWVNLTNMRIFADLDPLSFPNLTSLIVDEDMDLDTRQRQGSRVFTGLAQFISGLPRLEVLLTNQRVLLNPAHHPGEVLKKKKAPLTIEEIDWLALSHESLDECFAPGGTFDTLRPCLGRLRSCRLGFGPLSVDHLRTVVEALHPDVRNFGTELEWILDGDDDDDESWQEVADPAVFEIIGTLEHLEQFHLVHAPKPPKKFASLHLEEDNVGDTLEVEDTDHICSPVPNDEEVDANSVSGSDAEYEPSSEESSSSSSEDNSPDLPEPHRAPVLALPVVRALFEKCSSIVRVGVERSVVWERRLWLESIEADLPFHSVRGEGESDKNTFMLLGRNDAIDKHFFMDVFDSFDA